MGLRDRGRVTGLHRAGRGDRVDDVGLAVPAADLPVRATHLDHTDTTAAQVLGQGRTIGAGALDPDGDDMPEPAQPAQRGW